MGSLVRVVVVSIALALVFACGTASAVQVTIAGDPAVASEGSGAFDLFARGDDGHLYHQPLNNVWWGWADLGQPPSGAIVGKPSAVSFGPGHVDVFVRGSDNGLWHRWYGNG